MFQYRAITVFMNIRPKNYSTVQALKKKENRELLGLILLHCSRHFIMIILFVGMLEKAVFFSEYNNINITGETSKCSYFSLN